MSKKEARPKVEIPSPEADPSIISAVVYAVASEGPLTLQDYFNRLHAEVISIFTKSPEDDDIYYAVESAVHASVSLDMTPKQLLAAMKQYAVVNDLPWKEYKDTLAEMVRVAIEAMKIADSDQAGFQRMVKNTVKQYLKLHRAGLPESVDLTSLLTNSYPHIDYNVLSRMVGKALKQLNRTDISAS